MSDDQLLQTVEVVKCFISANKLDAAELPDLIKLVYQTLSQLGQEPVIEEKRAKATPLQIRKSITPDAIISFVDGKPYKTLKRHLRTHGLTLDEYRAKFGLPRDYPSVATNYSLTRSVLAKDLGLGKGPRGASDADDKVSIE